jgi:hypothetical protein
VCRADNLTTFMCRLSRNSGASTSWNPKGLSRPVAGKLYLYRLGILDAELPILEKNENCFKSNFSLEQVLSSESLFHVIMSRILSSLYRYSFSAS